MTTPQRIDWSRAQLQADLTMLDRQGVAVKRFYGLCKRKCTGR